MLRGTRIIEGRESELFLDVVSKLRDIAKEFGYKEVILPSIWESETFIEKAGKEVLEQMYVFKDKKEREICLIPEATAIVREIFKDSWGYDRPKPVKVCYLSRCYRYERPQAGRYREFWQFGFECLGGKSPEDKIEVMDMAKEVAKRLKVPCCMFNDSVKRGLDYYIEDGFEVDALDLGAQKQIIGGGRYDCGIGFAVGVDRVVMALRKE